MRAERWLSAGLATWIGFLALSALPAVRLSLIDLILLLALAAPPVVAAGFTWKVALFQIGGATMITGATWSVAAITVVYVLRNAAAASRPLLFVSSVAVLTPMVLALFWATAQYYDVAALSIPDMARIHGTINAFGFVGCGLAGWRLNVHR